MKQISLLIFGLCLNSGVMAATVWVPTDGDSNFFTTVISIDGGMLGLFDDEDQAYSGASLELSDSDLVIFTPDGGDFIATNLDNDTIGLSNTYNFILGLSLDGGSTWLEDTSITNLGNNAFRVFFGENQALAVDVRVVPLPAAFWLFGTAFMGLIGFSRRKTLFNNTFFQWKCSSMEKSVI